MRVTHVITRLIVGGAQENTIASVLGLRKKPDCDAELISGPSTGPEGSLESEFNAAPGVLTIQPQLVRPVHPWNDLVALQKLTRLFRERKPDIVHTHSGKAGVLGRIAAARAAVPVIVHTIHGPSFGPFQGGLANTVFLAAEKRAARHTTHFVSVADAMTRQYLDAGIGTPAQYSTIRSGFPLQPYLTARNDPSLRARLGLKPEDIVIGKIARLFKLKGHDDLFEVAPRLVKEMPQIKFLLVGDGEWRDRFEQMARDRNLHGHFIFTGLVPPEQIPALVGVMDIVVHLSQREGLPRALPQALAAAKPVVAYDCDGAREVCLDNQSGFLIRVGHLNGLTDRLLLLARDASLREQFGTFGQQFVRDRFSVEKMVDDLYSLYLKLAKKAGAND